MFCQKCKNLLIVAENKKCKNCGALVEQKIEFLSKRKVKKEIKTSNEQRDTEPILNAKCKKCGNDKVYCWSKQVDYADEPEVEFYRCTKCGYTWRSGYTP